MADNTQHKIGRNRPPRVQITYDVEIGNAIEKVEIPFVAGIMADLSGNEEAGRAHSAPIKDKSRSFVEIDRDNFGDVMAKIAPKLTVSVAGASGDAASADLTFKSLDDFDPAALVRNIPTLNALQTERSALRDILTKLDSNDNLYNNLMDRAKSGSLAAIGTAAATRLQKLQPSASANPDDGKDPVAANGKVKPAKA